MGPDQAGQGPRGRRESELAAGRPGIPDGADAAGQVMMGNGGSPVRPVQQQYLLCLSAHYADLVWILNCAPRSQLLSAGRFASRAAEAVGVAPNHFLQETVAEKCC